MSREVLLSSIRAWKREPLYCRIADSLFLAHIHGVLSDGEYARARARLRKRLATAGYAVREVSAIPARMAP